ncbi:MAG: hypothetical protein OXF02_06575 [Simkaniaceae bacterium]|nr:hypothetical protein [Simkaniaceae bacterium]
MCNAPSIASQGTPSSAEKTATIASRLRSKEKLAVRETGWFAGDTVRKIKNEMRATMTWDQYGRRKVSDELTKKLVTMHEEKKKGNIEFFAELKIEKCRKACEDHTKEIESISARGRELLERDTKGCAHASPEKAV